MKKSFLLLITPLLLISCGSNPINISSEQQSSSEQPSETPLVDFENVFFEDAAFVYDGNPHILDEVKGAPEGTSITYTGREAHTDVGTYTASALLTKEGYNNKTLSATLTINSASFADIAFDDASFEYDGQPHSIYVAGAPSFAMVTYTNNGKTNVGAYTVTAKISAANYNTLTKTATLTILGKPITGVTLSDQTFEYDGNKHSLNVEGELPDGVSVRYSNNGKTDAGTYEVTATLSGTGYETLTLKANLIITPVPLYKPGYFFDRAYMYDGNPHSLVVTEVSSSYSVTYKCLNASGTNTFTQPGSYIIEATVKADRNNLSVLKATLTIVEPVSYGVDAAKTGLTIDENLKWDQLHSALKGDNFTFRYLSGSYDADNLDDPLPATIIDDDFDGHDYRTTFVTDGMQAYSESLSTYSDPYHSYAFYTEVGDDISCFSFSTDNGSSDYEKFPKAAFSETVCRAEASNAFVALEKGDNGEFESGIDGDDYYKDAGVPFIRENQFIVLMFHPRSISSGYRYFYEVYKFYNIGNSKLDIPASCVPSQEFLSSEAALADYRLGGVKYRYSSYGSYSNMVKYYSAELYVSYHTKVFLEAGTYTVLPYIYDNPVRAIVHYSYYNQYWNYDQSGYTFNLYIDRDKNYQGEYADLGSVSRLDVSEVTSHGGTINYYADWND